MREGMGKPIPKSDMELDQHEQMAEVMDVKQEEFGIKREHRLELFREHVRVPSQVGLHTLETLRDRLEGSDQLSPLGWRDVRLDPSRSVVQADGTVLAIAIQVTTEFHEQRDGWLTVDFSADGAASYVNDINGEVVETVQLPKEFEMAWLQHASEQRKIVKSRPSWMYPELFHLPNEEVWPKDAKVAVIGDPFQSCDREGVTIIECEYADEMIPSYLRAVIDQENFDASLVEDWLRSTYFEDLESVGKMYGLYVPDPSGNPYQAMVSRCFELCAAVAEDLRSAREVSPEHRAEFRKLETFAKQLVDGSWSMKDAEVFLNIQEQESAVEDRKRKTEEFVRSRGQTLDSHAFDRYPKPQEELRNLFGLKQAVMEQLGDPAAWEKYLSVWERYFSNLPLDMLREHVPDIDQRAEQAQYWLKIIPTVKSSARVAKGLAALEKFAYDLFPYGNEEQPETAILHDPEVLQALDRDFGSFGFSVPGFPVNLRTKSTIHEGLNRVHQAMAYVEGLAPHLEKELQRLEELNIPLSPETKFQYFKTLEQAWVRQHFFVKRTQRAQPLHGFFPHKMQDIEPQDRILALTSVTMHGWNRMREPEFKKEIELSLPYLKPNGGKYILGPVNQYVYFGGGYSDFDADGLTRVLQQLASEGKITYEFHKGVREYHNANDEYEDNGTDQWDPNPAVLHNGESAHSLVITRLV